MGGQIDLAEDDDLLRILGELNMLITVGRVLESVTDEWDDPDPDNDPDEGERPETPLADSA